MKLFMFYVGGNCGNSNVELHDVRFSIGETAEDCHDDLRRQWWGDPESLHLDCWGAVEQADGFRSVFKIPDQYKLTIGMAQNFRLPAEGILLHGDDFRAAEDIQRKGIEPGHIAAVNERGVPNARRQAISDDSAQPVPCGVTPSTRSPRITA